jgi:hypothetical protein
MADEPSASRAPTTLLTRRSGRPSSPPRYIFRSFPLSPATIIPRLLSAAAKNTAWTFTATTQAHAQITLGSKAHDRMVSVLGPLFRTARRTVRKQHGVTASAGQRHGDVEIRNYLRDQAGSRSLVFDLSVTHERFVSSSQNQQNGLLTIRRTYMRLCVLLRSARSISIGNNTLTSEHFFSPCDCQHLHLHARRIFASLLSTGPPGDRGALDCLGIAIAIPFERVPFSQRGILTGLKSKVGLAAAKAVALRPLYRRLWLNCSTRARSLLRSPSSSPPSFTQSPFPPRSLVRDGQTSPHRPRLVESHSTCLSLSPCPHANSFVTGTAIINNNRDLHVLSPIAPRVPPRYCGRRACGRDDTTAGMPGRWQACTVCGRNEMISCGIPFMKRPLNVPAEDFA